MSYVCCLRARGSCNAGVGMHPILSALLTFRERMINLIVFLPFSQEMFTFGLRPPVHRGQADHCENHRQRHQSQHNRPFHVFLGNRIYGLRFHHRHGYRHCGDHGSTGISSWRTQQLHWLDTTTPMTMVRNFRVNSAHTTSKKR